jgi:hypothetical protein
MAPILVGERFKRYSNAGPPNGPCDPRPEEDQASVLYQKFLHTEFPQVS